MERRKDIRNYGIDPAPKRECEQAMTGPEGERDEWRQRNPGVDVSGGEIDVMVELEHIIGESIPRVGRLVCDTFGFTAVGGHVARLGLRVSKS
nr:hypothetical protein [Candidatus Sigynarchaeota archaeon]